ncbi:MAG: serine/threonine protein kinase, partial [Planctomycetota bacterium]
MGTDLEAPPEADPYLGKTIAGRFEVENVLGEGGMGKVYGAKDQEARTAGRLRHEAAVRIVAFGETESGAPYLAMEYCLGVTLKDMLAKEGHLPIARACNIASQMIDAVGSAHKQGIIHRDLKPENIKIAPDAMRGEAVKVLDFGVAKFIGGEDAPEMENAVKTKTGIILGTPKYMAPEQIRGEQVDGRADLYSCGAILYELLSGTPPFTADDVFGYVSKHLKEPPMKLADRVPEYAIPQELDDLVMWMLEKNPVQRPKDAASINAILDKFAKGSSSARLKF